MSYIKKIIINNYKSIKKIELDLKENLNIIIGPNNSGKSNIISSVYESLSIRDVNSAYSHISRLDNFERRLPQVKIITNKNDEIYFNSDKFNSPIAYKRNGISSVLHDKEAINKVRHIKIAKVDNHLYNEEFIKEIYEFLEGLSAEEMAIVLSNINKDLLLLSNQYYSLLIYDDRLYVADSYGDTAPISEKSNGVKKLVIMAYWINKYNLQNREIPDVIIFDEPEVHLHTEAQRFLYFKLKEVFKKSQIIISTHSATFINNTDSDNIFLIDRDAMNGTYLDNKIGDKQKLIRINNIMGINLLDTLRINSSYTTVLVEGKTDKNYHKYIYHRLFPRKNLNFWEIEGANRIVDFISVYKELFPNPPMGILDYDQKGIELIKSIKSKYGNDYNKRIILNNNKNIINYSGDEKIETGRELEVEDLFEKKFLHSAIEELVREDDSIEGEFESFNNKISNCKNFCEIEKMIKDCNFKYKNSSEYKINKYRLNIKILEKLQLLNDLEFRDNTKNFHELYKEINKNK
ncbi:AAA family ATPase [Mammaliicoccus sciuri]|uniref:ATP-dependent nuclease n=1 Tax=Mammaliicoccus sciuri TaxID=1296 RepID=UPI001E4A355E|nr:AAA family ATPase [Mammaliicoccus sciuri]MCD8801527.1 AAA family ATPase [Mammaliicoccus sciuri]